MSQLTKKQEEELRESAKRITSISKGNLANEIKERARLNTQGAVIGGIIGVVGAIALRKKPLYGVLVGAIAGRLILHFTHKK